MRIICASERIRGALVETCYTAYPCTFVARIHLKSCNSLNTLAEGRLISKRAYKYACSVNFLFMNIAQQDNAVIAHISVITYCVNLY